MINRPEDDPVLQTPEMRQMLWALQFSATPEMSHERAAAVWGEVKRQAGVRSVDDPGEAVRRLWGGLARGWRLVTAMLVPEVLVPSPAVRGAATALPKLLVYETDSFSISLSFMGSPQSDRIKLVGQVVPKVASEIPAGGKVALWSDRETVFGDVNEYGEFTVESASRGELHMDILLGTESIQLSPIQTRAVQVTED